MLKDIKISQVMVLDIETVPVSGTYDDLTEQLKIQWQRRAERISKGEETETDSSQLFSEKAGIYAEFGKIICISAGIFQNTDTGLTLRIKSFAGHDEKKLLTGFKDMLDHSFTRNTSLKIPDKYLCAHNGKDFDFPYMARRMLINGIGLPQMLDIAGRKPWETTHLLDTMDLWRFGDFKNYTSLDLLAAVFGISSPKDDIKGSDVARVYWQDDDLPRIVEYCCKDVSTLAGILLRFKGMEALTDEQVINIE